jgi:hypothetical protein
VISCRRKGWFRTMNLIYCHGDDNTLIMRLVEDQHFKLLLITCHSFVSQSSLVHTQHTVLLNVWTSVWKQLAYTTSNVRYQDLTVRTNRTLPSYDTQFMGKIHLLGFQLHSTFHFILFCNIIYAVVFRKDHYYTVGNNFQTKYESCPESIQPIWISQELVVRPWCNMAVSQRRPYCASMNSHSPMGLVSRQWDACVLCDCRIHNDRASRTASSQQCACPFYSSRAGFFFDKASHYPGLSAPLQTRIGSLWLLAFPKAKIAIEREEICECDGHTVHKISQQYLTADWLAPQESDCSWMHREVSYDWLPSYIKSMQPVLEIFKMAGCIFNRLGCVTMSAIRGWLSTHSNSNVSCLCAHQEHMWGREWIYSPIQCYYHM